MLLVLVRIVQKNRRHIESNLLLLRTKLGGWTRSREVSRIGIESRAGIAGYGNILTGYKGNLTDNIQSETHKGERGRTCCWNI